MQDVEWFVTTVLRSTRDETRTSRELWNLQSLSVDCWHQAQSLDSARSVCCRCPQRRAVPLHVNQALQQESLVLLHHLILHVSKLVFSSKLQCSNSRLTTATRYSKGTWTDFDAKYDKICGSAQGCAFSGSWT